MDKNQNAKNQILNIIFVLGGGIVFATLVVIGTLIYYGPSVRYNVKEILLSPKVSKQLSFMDHDRTTGKMVRFVFNGIEIQKPGNRGGKLTDYQYDRIYKIIQNDKSMNDPPNRVKNAFQSGQPTRVTLSIKVEGEFKTTKPFQKLQYIDDYYRIELRNSYEKEIFAYFYHPNISGKLNNIFNE